MISRRDFLRLAGACGLMAAGALPGCAGARGTGGAGDADDATGSAAGTQAAPGQAAGASAAGGDAIVVFFSRAGENYGVGTISEGNTAIVAGMVAEATGAELFEIVPSEAYPEGYDDCCDVALDEKNAKARPAYVEDVNLDAYSTVYLGYPIWWGDLPMCVYTFIEAHDWAGKSVLPFCTHGGSGLAGTVGSIESACAGAEVGKGLAIEGVVAQNSRDSARSSVDGWLS